MRACPFLLGPNPETLSTLASPPMGRFEFFPRFFLVLGGLRREEFKSSMEKLSDLAMVQMNQKLSLLSCFRCGTIRSLSSFSMTVEHPRRYPTIVHSHQLLHTSSARPSPSPRRSVRQAGASLLCVWAPQSVGGPPKLAPAAQSRCKTCRVLG